MMMMLLVLLFNGFKWVFGGGRMLFTTIVVTLTSTQLSLLKLIPQLGKEGYLEFCYVGKDSYI
jgi:hypothetical protein